MRAIQLISLASLLASGVAWDPRMDTNPRVVTRDNKVVINAVDAEFALDGANFSIKDFKAAVEQGLADSSAAQGAAVTAINETLRLTRTQIDAAQDLLRSDVEDSVGRVERQVNGLDVLTPSASAAGLTTALGNSSRNLLCAINHGKNSVYSAIDGGSCVCPADRRWDAVADECVTAVGLGLSENYPGVECSTILRKWPGAPSGRYWIRPGERMAAPMPTFPAFPAYCDMESQGGGWTLIESYDISRKGEFRHKPFHANWDFGPHSNSPPTDYDSNDQWDYYRMSSMQMSPMLKRSVEVHARCDRRMSRTPNDWLVGDSSAVRLVQLSGQSTNPRQSAYNKFSFRGRLRGVELGELNLNWYHASNSGSPWHAGFDVGTQIPGSMSSEDDFTWHDGGLNPSQHRCHRGEGDITWWLRGPADLGSQENPAMSCQHILKADPTTRGANGPYWLMLPFNGLTNVYCEMTAHEGGWTMWAGFAMGTNAVNIGSNDHWTTVAGSVGISKAYPSLGNNPQFKFSAMDINFIRESWRTWGGTVSPPYAPDEYGASYWTTTPQSGIGHWGAENFHPQNCRYQANRKSSAIKTTSCAMNRWFYSPDIFLANNRFLLGSDSSSNPWGGSTSDRHARMTKGSHVAWVDGGHWWDNSNGYRSWAGYHNEGHHSTGGTCYSDGRGLGYHVGSHAPFHRGWCGTRAWGLEFIRG